MKKKLENRNLWNGGAKSLLQWFSFTLFVLAVLVSTARAQEVITGRPGQASNRASITFDNMVGLDEQFRLTNQAPREIPPPMPLTNNPSGGAGGGGGGEVQAAAFPAPPPGGFSAQASPLPDMTFQGLDDNGFVIPPDTHGAVGPNHLMVALNRGVRIQDRNGVSFSTVTLPGFWSVLRVIDVFDPKVLYDPYGQRWIMTAMAERRSDRSSVLIGVSQSSNPRGRWNLYRVDADESNQSWADYPSIGFNKDWITVTVNMFPIFGGGRTFTGVNIYNFNKQDLYTNGTGRFTLFQENSGRGFTMCPTITHDPLHPTMYLLETDSLVRNFLTSSRLLRMSTITGPVGSEVLTVGTALIDPENPWTSSDPFLLVTGSLPQLGSQFGIIANDSRIQNVVYRNGTIWATHHMMVPDGAPDRCAVQWYQLNPVGSIIQYGRLEDTNSIISYAYPSIAVNRNNDVLIGFSKFASNIYPSAAYAFRSCEDPPGTFRADHVYKAGETTYVPFGFVFTNFFFTPRWGDYSATVVDPVNDLDMWTIQEYAPFTFGRWDTWWAKVAVNTACSQIAFAQNEYTVREGAIPGVASIEVLNLGGAPGSIDFATSDGTAVAGVDYLGRSGTLTFAPGQLSTNFTIVILDDPFTNGNRTVNLTLSNPGGGAQLGFLSNAVLVIQDDEAVEPLNVAGEFNYSAYFKPDFFAGLYFCTENETCTFPCGNDVQRRYTPDRTAQGAIITVVRTNGTTGRVMIDYETAPGGTAIPNVDFTPVSGTLVFDHLQTSTNFLVPVASDFFPNGFKFVRLVLSNPRPAPEEDAVRPGFLRPTLGPGSEAGLVIMEINHGLTLPGTTPGTVVSNNVLNFERVNYRVDEYPGGPGGAPFGCIFGGVERTGGSFNGYRLIAVSVMANANVSGTMRVSTSDDTGRIILLNPDFQAGSEQAEHPNGGSTIWNNPVFTDPTLSRITNHLDYFSLRDTNSPALARNDGGAFPNDLQQYQDAGVILTFADECRKSLIIAVTNDSTVEFNEDIVVLLDPRPGDLEIGFNWRCHITIVADDQPAGALDREWNADGVGKSDPPFNDVPGTDGVVSTLAVQQDGKTLLGGDFTDVNAKPRNRIARMNFNGTLDLTFNPPGGANDFVTTVIPYPTNDLFNGGKILVAGAFSSMNNVSRRGIARLNPDGSLDNTFNPGNGVNVGGVVRSMALQPDGKILIAGEFFEYDDFPRSGFARLNPDGTLDLSFDIGVGADNNVWAIGFTPDPFAGFKVIVGGEFIFINGEFRAGIAQLNPDGSVDPNFNPGSGVNGPVYSLAVQTNGQVIIAGFFNDLNAVRRNNIARLNTDGSIDLSFDPGTGTDDAIYSVVLQPNQKAMIGGIFTIYNRTRRLGIARLQHNGQLDTSFMDTAYNQFAGIPNSLSWEPPNFIRAIALQPDENVMIGGYFKTVGGNPSEDEELRNYWTVYTRQDKRTRHNIARLIGGITPGPGNAEFDEELYYVNEHGSNAFVRLQRSNGRLGSLYGVATNITSSATGTETDPANADFVSTNRANVWAEHRGDAPRPRSVGSVGGVFFRIPILDDLLREGDEQMDLSFLRPDGDVTLGGEPIQLGGALGREHARLTISDNDGDPGFFNFTTDVYLTNEHAGLARITVIRTNGTQGTVSVDYRTQPAVSFPATPAVDYWPVQGRLTFGQGETSKFFTIPLTNDTLVEFDEYIQLILTNASGGARLPGGLQTSVALAQLRIVDNDFPPGRINFAFGAYTNAETDGTATILVSRTGGSMDSVSVQVETVFTGSAANGSDYQHATATLIWANGESGPKPFTVPLLTDGVVEGNESLRIRLFDPRVRGVTDTNLFGAVTNATLVIRDTDFPGSITFGQPLYQADENASFVAINLLRSGGIAGSGTVTFTAEPDSASAGSDFIPVTTNVTFAPGQIGAAVFVRLVDDSQADGNKSVALRLSNPVGVGLGVLPSVSLVIIDNESFNEIPGESDTAFDERTQTDGPIYSMALQSTNGIIDGRIVIAGDFTEVNRVPRSGLARVNTNGTLDASFNVGLGPNAPTRAVAVQPDGKLLVGGFFTQFNNTNRAGLARLHIDGTLDEFFNPGSGADNPVYSIVIQPDEKVLVGGAFSRFNGVLRPGIVRLNTNGTVDLSFDVQAGPNGNVYAVALQSDGKVVIGGEFTTVNSITRNRLARLNRDGSLDTTFNGTVGFDAPVRSILVQPDGRIVVGGSFVTVNGVARSYLARLNTDGSLDNTFMNGLSGANNAVYALALQVDGKIIVAGDFTRFNDVTRNRLTRVNADGSTDTSINFGSGANAFITSLLIQPDRKIVFAGGFTQYDDKEHLRIARIHGGSIAGFGALTFSTHEFRVSENDGEILVSVKRKGGTEGTVSVNFQTLNNTAVAGTDYRATNGVLTFTPGETILGFQVAIFNNAVTNQDRIVDLLLSGYSGGATSGPQPSARLVIVNDESAVGFTQPAFSANENSVSGNGTLTLRRTYAISNFLTVNFATVPGGTATPGVDYVPTNSSITFLPGEIIRNIHVRLINDTNIEPNETVNVVISNPTATTGSGVFLDRTNAVLTIVEDDFGPGQVTLEQSEYSVREDGGAVNLTVVRTNGSTGVISVRYRTADNSAIGGFDFVPTNSVLAFADGETRKTISIIVFDDTITEGTENFSVVLSDPQGGAALGSRSAANVTIQDNDTNLIVAAGAVIIAESGPVNNFVDPGETVTVAFGLRNIGTSSTSNLVATLQNTPNLSATPPASQSYGALIAGGSSAFRNYTFTASGAVGFRLVATLLLNDGLQNYGQVSYAFTLGGQSTNSFCNTNRITINDNVAATPYPSSLVVSNVGGVVNKVVVTLNRFTHGFPDDVDVLLEGPDGQTVMLMSDVGGGGPVNGLTLSFDDKVANILPDSGPLTSGTYRPANYASLPTAADSFPLPAPQPVAGGFSPYTNTALSVFAGINPNGAWRLYVVDDTGDDSGVITNGWCLTLVSGDPVSSGVDLALTGQDSPDPVIVGSPLTYRWGITNVGFGTASGIVFSTTVDPKVTFLSASAGSGTPSLVGSNLTHNIGTLAPGAGTFVQMVVQPNFGGFTKTNVATVQSGQTDLNPADNTLRLTTAVVAPSLSILRNGNDVVLSWPAAASGFVLQQSDELTPPAWSDVTTQPVIIGNQKRVTLRAIESCRCYRLRKL